MLYYEHSPVAIGGEGISYKNVLFLMGFQADTSRFFVRNIVENSVLQCMVSTRLLHVKFLNPRHGMLTFL